MNFRKSRNLMWIGFAVGILIMALGLGHENEKIIGGLTKYVTTGTDSSYCVYFNAKDEERTIDTTGYTKAVDVTSGSVVESTTLPTVVAAKGFVILKK